MRTLICALVRAVNLPAAPPIRVMLLDGESAGSYHAWQLTTPVLKKELDEAGIFEVHVVTAPPSSSGFTNFKPDFAKYDVVVSNYDAAAWPENLKSEFGQYVKN